MKTSLKLLHLCLIALIITLVNLKLAQAADPTLTNEAYWQKLQQSHTTVAALAEARVEVQREELTQLATEWAAVEQVILDDGTAVAVDHTALIRLLQTEPPDIAQVQARLETLLQARETWPTPRHTLADVESLQPILARAEFQWQAPEPSVLARWWGWLVGKFWEFISNFLPDGTVITLNGNFISYILTFIGTMALLLVLFFIMREMLFNLVTEVRLDPTGEAGDEHLTAESAFNKAQALSGDGDYRTAVRYLYLSSLLQLDERGLLRYDRAQTNREYLRKVAHLPALATMLREVIDVFDRVWYGYQPLDEATYARYAARVAELRRQR